MMKRTVLLLCVALPAVGCATEKQMGPLNTRGWLRTMADPNEAAELEAAMTDEGIAMTLDANVTAKLPTKLAVARGGTYSCHYGADGTDLIGREELDGWKRAFRDEEGIVGIEPVAPFLDGSRPTLRSLRMAAARQGCELLLVYVQADGAVDNFNNAAVLYWTLAGLWLAPGNTYERRTVMQAVLVDCRTGVILGTTSGEAGLKQDYIAAYGDIVKQRLNRQAPDEALADLQTHCREMIARAVAAARLKAGRVSRS